jgi:hypothetical protein
LRPSATPHEAPTAWNYDLTIVDVASGVVLFAFEKLIATLSDWLAICQPSVPAIYDTLASHSPPGYQCRQRRTPSPGVSMPPVTIKLESTKLDMRNGSSTGSPVSG